MTLNHQKKVRYLHPLLLAGMRGKSSSRKRMSAENPAGRTPIPGKKAKNQE